MLIFSNRSVNERQNPIEMLANVRSCSIVVLEFQQDKMFPPPSIYACNASALFLG